MIDLLNGGYGYTSEPTVILRGGKLDNYDYPYSFVQGSRVVLEAEAFDTDGVVREVRFYGNGALLGAAPLGLIQTLEVVSPGSNFAEPPRLRLQGVVALVL